MKACIAIQILPATLDDNEVIRIVDEVIAYIASTGYSYYVGPCETAIEGDDFAELMEIAKNCCVVATNAGCGSVSAYIKATYTPAGEVLTIEKKVTKHHQ